MSNRRIKIEYVRRDERSELVMLRLTTPDGSIITQAMTPGDVAHLELTARALDLPVERLSQGEALYAKALALAPTGSVDEISRLTYFLANNAEPAS